MFNYDLPKDQDRLHARICLEVSTSEITKRFVTQGEAYANRPRPTFTPEFRQLTVPLLAEGGSKVPVVHARSGYVEFGVAEWGLPITAGELELFRKAERRSIGWPGLIPASFIEMATTTADAKGRSTLLRIGPHTMFIGCVVYPDQLGRARYVVPLIREAGRYVAPYTDWEMLLVPIFSSPEPNNFRFILREDNGWLQVAPSPRVNIEHIDVERSAATNVSSPENAANVRVA
jgi:hypothetical protein